MQVLSDQSVIGEPRPGDDAASFSAAATGKVLGHLAKYQIWGTPQVSWLDRKYLYTVGQMPFDGVGTYRYDQQALFRIANSMH